MYVTLAKVLYSYTESIIPPKCQKAVALQKCMALAGWEIAHIDLDLTGERPKAEIKLERSDGRWLLARVDRLGRVSFETFHRERTLTMSRNTKGRRPLSPQVDDVFLGRHHCLGARHMLREMTAYIASNATTPVRLADVRQAWAAVMGAPLRLTASGCAEGSRV
ncbi:hypothetical protein [Cupriavidus sp. TMH.W2]|uniref:hypothetical protein n=1 Tax=Cupriavidus sp. TMH.W2 TaxID=3434465 RepID=UPI003D770664